MERFNAITLGGFVVQGQGKGHQLISIKVVNDYIGLATSNVAIWPKEVTYVLFLGIGFDSFHYKLGQN